MKKRVLCLLTALLLCAALSANAAGGLGFSRRVQYGPLVSYENLLCGYALSMFARFSMVPEEQMEEIWASIDANREEGDDEIYDLRIWIAPDSRYRVEVQVKEPTYDSFETEIAKAPEYLELVKDSYAPENNVRQLHEGILRETPAGTMLETALAYDLILEDGSALPLVFVYYDIYDGAMEYCFSVYAYDGDYDAAQALLDEIAQTVRLQHYGLRV